MSRSRIKPPELTEGEVVSERTKRLIQDVKRIAGGKFYVYQWNVDKSEASSVGLFVDPASVHVQYTRWKDR